MRNEPIECKRPSPKCTQEIKPHVNRKNDRDWEQQTYDAEHDYEKND